MFCVSIVLFVTGCSSDSKKEHIKDNVVPSVYAQICYDVNSFQRLSNDTCEDIDPVSNFSNDYTNYDSNSHYYMWIMRGNVVIPGVGESVKNINAYSVQLPINSRVYIDIPDNSLSFDNLARSSAKILTIGNNREVISRS